MQEHKPLLGIIILLLVAVGLCTVIAAAEAQPATDNKFVITLPGENTLEFEGTPPVELTLGLDPK